jgi:hypothetical protein
VIEKFEREASRCDLAIILLTPDDEATTSGGIGYRTARPNVLFELGYFMAKFGRKSGRTLIIYRKGLDMPSDLSGVVYIDASQGIISRRWWKSWPSSLTTSSNRPDPMNRTPRWPLALSMSLAGSA